MKKMGLLAQKIKENLRQRSYSSKVYATVGDRIATRSKRDRKVAPVLGSLSGPLKKLPCNASNKMQLQ